MQDPNSLSAEQFEREVLRLLRLQGWSVIPEQTLGHKKVDGYAEKRDSFGQMQRMAVECKNHRHPFPRSGVSSIYADYRPLIEANLIDFALLVTAEALAPSAYAYLKETRSLRHVSYLQLLNSILDFSNYVSGLHADFLRGNISTFYVPQKSDQGDTLLEELLMQWAADEDEQPIAILGGYGIGKSTLARRVAHLLAQEHLTNPTARIPVLIPLADISTDQNLEGLLGRHFTSICVVPNYNYRLFMALNEKGRFVILLDGFDEMKKTMSWESLSYNLRQLNQLVVRRSKVILLGRPTAFLTSAEHNEALHGRRSLRGIEKRVPDWPDYREVRLREFSRQQVMEFITKFLSECTRDGEHSDKGRRRIQDYMEQLGTSEGKRLLDLASRPVQLKMLMDVLPDYEGNIDEMTVATLFSEFIDLVIRREVEKRTRDAFTREQRRKFATSLACWMWCEGHGSEVAGEKILESLFRPYVHEEQEVANVKRDLLAGCFLERKPPNQFYFPHRSFQEFLVAERLCDLLISGESDLSDCPFLTRETMSFFVELTGKERILEWKNRMTGRVNRINEHCADLLDAACEHYGWKSPVTRSLFQTKHELEPGGAAQGGRTPLVDKIVSKPSEDPKEEENARKKRRQTKMPHRLTGVTRKSKYRH